MDLTAKKCVACEGGVPPLAGAALGAYLKEVKDWEVVDPDAAAGAGVQKIRKEFKFKDFKTALAFVNRVGAIAESEGHHPDIGLSWGRVIITLWTHAIGGLSENDFILAAKVDAL